MNIANTKIKDKPLDLPRLGFGSASIGNLYSRISDEVAEATVLAAWQHGFRYFDTAPYYGLGLSERRLGDALRAFSRDDFKLSTKVGRVLNPAVDIDVTQARYGFESPMPFEPTYDYTYDGVMKSYEASLQRLGLSRIDILLVHDIGALTHGDANAQHFSDLESGGYRALEELRRAGDIEAIGLGVNEWQVCEAAMEVGEFDCFLLAGRYTLLEQLALESFFPKCIEHGASVILGGAYNSGILATGVNGEKIGYYNYEPAPAGIVERVRVIEDVACRYSVTLAAAALQFPLAHEVVASVIPGIGNVSRVSETKALFEEVIPIDFWRDLKTQGVISSDAPVPVAESRGA